MGWNESRSMTLAIGAASIRGRDHLRDVTPSEAPCDVGH